MICLDIPICQTYVFRQNNNLYKMFKYPAVLTVCIQLILHFLEIIIFRMA